jgi:hypothetical protein
MVLPTIRSRHFVLRLSLFYLCFSTCCWSFGSSQISRQPKAHGPVVPLSATQNPNDYPQKHEKSLQAIQACYEAAALSAVVDGVTSCLTLRKSPTIEPAFALLKTFWKLGLVVGLWSAENVYRSADPKKPASEALVSIFRIMSRLWRRSTWIVALGSTLDVATAFQRDRPWRMAVVTVVGGFALREVSAKETKEFQKDDDPARRVGLNAVQTMAVCTGSLVLRGIVDVALVIPKPTLLSKLLQAAGTQTPFLMARQLWLLRRAVLKNLVAITSTKRGALTITEDLLDAQTKFYSNVASTFKADAVLKTVVALVQQAKSR